jgi:hypothetical protein
MEKQACIRKVWPLLLVVFLFTTGCATYYQKNLEFQEAFYEGDFKRAEKLLDGRKKAATDRNRLLYFLQKGVVLQLQGEYAESNRILEQAYYFTQDYQTNYLRVAAGFLTNPSVAVYEGEDHEVVLLHYYKAMNYLMLNEPEEAMVEIRRIGIKQQQLKLTYEDKQYHYKQDAFIQNLMGLAYEASGDLNDAFIAYRNSYETYKTLYSQTYHVACPEQLKKDLVRTAGAMGFVEEQLQFEKETGYRYADLKKPKEELVFFWQNGLGPVKDEWSIMFTVVHGNDGIVTFQNEGLGLSFPFPLPSHEDGKGGLGDLKVVRVAFPKYVERTPVFTQGSLHFANGQTPLERAENVNEIAFTSLEDRMLREMGSSLLRLALKQAITAETRKQNEELGAVLSVANALTEKADTRNWQTLPHDIYYARIPLQSGSNTVEFRAEGVNGANTSETFTFETNNQSRMQFHVFSTMATQ